MPKIILKNKNSLKEMKIMEENSVDHTITSPPYNMNLRVRGGKYVSRQIVREISTKYSNFDDNLTMEEYFNFTKKTLKELLRITEKYVFYNVQFITGNKRALFKIIGEFSDYIKEIIIWNKMHGQPAIANGVMNSQYEIILVLTKNKQDSILRQFKNASFERGTLSNVWDIKRGRSKLKGHSAVFPEELINKILKNFTNKEDVIFDPFMGTGVSGEASIKNQRNYLGIELSKEYFEFAKKKLNEDLLK
ncbi:MAG: site-specific DNA-methyltransferase [Mollicutes bacterium PWAP]|nr:site-specific DNA-methyltransferase [Mollicutes bacterium PWAP]